MSVKKIPSMIKKSGDKHLHLHMKSYHKEKDGQAFAKKHCYKVSNYVKTGAGSRMNIEEFELYDDLIGWNLSFGISIKDTIDDLDIDDDKKKELYKIFLE